MRRGFWGSWGSDGDGVGMGGYRGIVMKVLFKRGVR